jgi:UDP-N-acetylmuramoyl-L-alanyl-D-glutamate--2,6-diaminopimelate ligase
MTSASGRGVSLAALVASLGDVRVDGPLDRRVLALAHDSRRVAPETLFVALRGERADGHAFVAPAIAAGACAVVVDAAFPRFGLPAGATVVTVADTRRALARLAAEFYGKPSQALHVFGVTGTNGKTTTTALLQAILDAAGIACGRIGTLGADFGGVLRPLENTTPPALELQATLADMRARGARAVALEVSSHALALERTAEVRFEAAALTNVTRDHLDFHGTFEAYAAAKRSLFERAPYAAFCSDDPLGARWSREFATAHGEARVTTFGLDEGARLRATGVTLEGGRTSFALDGTRFTLQLPGRFNVRNALAAIALGRRLDVSDAVSAAAMAAVRGVAGRMEYVGAHGIDVLVDYAHTPDALANVLRAAREFGRGRLIVVFGCGGDRDRGKRPEMGAVAAALADEVVVTSDNPRGEEPGAILAEIAAGIPASTRYALEPDRARAIERAIFGAVPGDVVVIAGKGHETYQISGARTLHFDDREVARDALGRRAHASLAAGGGRA